MFCPFRSGEAYVWWIFPMAASSLPPFLNQRRTLTCRRQRSGFLKWNWETDCSFAARPKRLQLGLTVFEILVEVGPTQMGSIKSLIDCWFAATWKDQLVSLLCKMWETVVYSHVPIHLTSAHWALFGSFCLSGKCECHACFLPGKKVSSLSDRLKEREILPSRRRLTVSSSQYWESGWSWVSEKGPTLRQMSGGAVIVASCPWRT